MAERSNAAVSKTVMRLSGASRVQIPPSPLKEQLELGLSDIDPRGREGFVKSPEIGVWITGASQANSDPRPGRGAQRRATSPGRGSGSELSRARPRAKATLDLDLAVF